MEGILMFSAIDEHDVAAAAANGDGDDDTGT